MSVNDYNDKTVSYTYGRNGERTSITYPDEKKVDYLYDDNLCLSKLVNGEDVTSYSYNEYGRLIEKLLPNNNREVMDYLPGGHLKSLEMFYNAGLLDKYIYSYDGQGNRTQIKRSRRELDDISGMYSYEYDLVNRLTQVNLNGNPLRSYSYDAYGNRRTLVENGVTTKYNYDALDRLLESVSDTERKVYNYDNRGNQTSIIENGTITKTFTFDAANMLAKVTDEVKGEATYSYNGFGKRVAVTRPEEKILNYMKLLLNQIRM